MTEPALVHQSTYTKAEMVSTEDGMELRITTDIKKLKKDYPFKLPDTVVSHIPMVNGDQDDYSRTNDGKIN